MTPLLNYAFYLETGCGRNHKAAIWPSYGCKANFQNLGDFKN